MASFLLGPEASEKKQVKQTHECRGKQRLHHEYYDIKFVYETKLFNIKRLTLYVRNCVNFCTDTRQELGMLSAIQMNILSRT